MNDTIVAVSTALGVGAISIIRLSGDNSIKIANKVFVGKNLIKAKSHTLYYGHISDKGRVIDEVLVAVMKKPKTYTKEDVVEINCHGGIATTNKVLELLLNKGATLAEPGEFTKRAFLNGRIDLIEAEGVIDLINSKNEKARKLAINQVEGKVSILIKRLRRDMLDILTNIEVNIDYPEYEDITKITNNMVRDNLKHIKKQTNELLIASENSKIIKEGIKTLILGRPNVGKSSLLNNLINEEKAIVTDIKGTTRDIVEGNFMINGILFNVYDTAGIRETTDLIEKIGVEKSIKLIDAAALVILVLNNNEPLSEEDLKLIQLIDIKKRIIYLNKIDLEPKLDKSKIPGGDLVEGTTLTIDGTQELINIIKLKFDLEQLESDDFMYLSTARQVSILKEITLLIDEVFVALDLELPIDIVEIDLKKIWDLLGQIIGESYSEELIDHLFNRFCLGK